MVTALDRAYDVQIHQLRLRVSNFATRYWNSMGSWRDDDIERLLEFVTPLIRSGQQRVSDLTDAYLSRVLVNQGGKPSGRPFQATTPALRGITDEVLYARPFATMHESLGKGDTVTAAVAAGRARLTSLIMTNMQLAKTHAARKTMTGAGARAYERVPTGRENCALCVIASTQRYFVADLQPIHPGCDCHVRPLTGDPAQHIIHPDRLEQIHRAVEGQFGESDRGARYIDGRNAISDYLDLIAVRHHGEYGPTLSWRGEHFTGPDNLTRKDPT